MRGTRSPNLSISLVVYSFGQIASSAFIARTPPSRCGRPSVTRRDSQFGERHLMKSERESRESGLPCPSVGNVTIFHLEEYSNRRSSRSKAAQQSVDVPLRVPGFSAAGPCVFCQRTCAPRDFSVVGSEECLQVAPRLGALSSTRSEVGRWPHCVLEVPAPSVGVSP